MTISEFKAWLEGFEAALNGPPNEDQWETIKAKITQLREPAGLPSGYKWRDPAKPTPWWEVEPTIRYTDDRTVPICVR